MGEESPGEFTLPELPDLSSIKRLSLDSETDGVNCFKSKPVGLSITYRTDKLNKLYLPFGHSVGNLDKDLVLNWCNTELRDKEIVFANAKFDIHMLYNLGVDLEKLNVKPSDIAFNGALLDDDRRAGLDLASLAKEYTDLEKLEFNGDKSRMKEYPSWLVKDYAERDAEATYLVDENTQSQIRNQGLEKVLALENSIIYAICDIERNGCRIDVDKLTRWNVQVKKELQEILFSLYSEVGTVNPNSPESLVKIFRSLSIPMPTEMTSDTNKKGKAIKSRPSFTNLFLKSVNHPTIKKILRARQLDSLLSKFLGKFLDGVEGDLLRFQLHQLKGDSDFGTISGRFSSSGGGEGDTGYSFNVQQVYSVEKQSEEIGDDYIIRELFIPDEGYKFFACDAKQIEYRLFAILSKAPKILKAYQDDPEADYHQVIMDIIKPKIPTITRKPVKNVNFARLYGAQTTKIAKMLGLSKPEAEAFLKDYDAVLPEAGGLMRAMMAEAEQKGFVSTLYGRRARFKTGERLHSALNRVIQGLAADLYKMKLKRIYEERHTLGIHKLRQPVHDEQCGDISPDPTYHFLLEECFAEQELELSVPILWDNAFGNNWRACK